MGPLLRARAEGAPAHLVRVVELSGFGLRDSAEGGVARSDRVEGRLLAGLADEAVAGAARSGRRLVRTTVADSSAEASGLVCGGVATLVLTPLAELPDDLFAWLAEARPVVLATPADGGPGALVVTARQVAGTLAGPGADGAPHDEAVLDAARALLEAGRSDRQVVEVGGRSLLLTAVVPSPRLLVVGGGAMAGAISDQARLLGWRVSITEDVDEAAAFVDEAGPADAVVVLSHDPDLDTAVLARAVASDAGYVGAMGSRATQSARRRRLLGLGLDEAALTRIHGPVGLDLGARTPPETAVAIVAEVLAERAGRAPASLTGRPGPING